MERRLLKQQAPRLTVIAPTTPMAYMSANAWRSSDTITRISGKAVATAKACQGTPCGLSRVNVLGISRSRASM